MLVFDFCQKLFKNKTKTSSFHLPEQPNINNNSNNINDALDDLLLFMLMGAFDSIFDTR